MKHCAIFLAIAFLGSFTLVFATDFSSSNFIIKDPVITPGGGDGTSTSFGLRASVSQIAIGISSSTTFGLRAGFLFFPAPTATTSSPGGGSSGGGAGAGGAGGGGGGGTGVPGYVLGLPTSTPFAGSTSSFQFPGETPFLSVCPLRGDFNCSGEVGFADLSIMLFYFNKPGTLALAYDLNGDGRLDAADISILFYYWNERLA